MDSYACCEGDGGGAGARSGGDLQSCMRKPYSS